MITYGFTKELNQSFSEATNAVTSALKQEGFGILTRIDVKEKFREKLSIDFPNYVILGACHPLSAHQAMLAEENIGLLLPCNVIVFEKNDKTMISIIKPSVAMSMIENEKLETVAVTVESKLKHVVESL